MSDEIVFYHNPQSRGRMVHWMLEETGAPYRFELLSFEKRENKKPEFLAVNPMGKLPAIVHHGTVITECGAIITYLADAFPAAKLAPSFDDPARGTYLRWMFFGQGCIEPALIDRMLSRPPVDRPTAIGYGTYDDVVHAVETALTPGPYILGSRFSAADVYIGSQLAFGMMMKSLDSRPLFQGYVSLLSQRPAYQRFSGQSDKLAAQMKQ
ncbi:MAG TPA: glutathione S-transferase family protein [Steroidobacteraceae bacterium]|jgi:glutathione S-transferase|nr:glutathione S-transferase family protein [Steroidobacteraceae bacterium]